MIMGRRPVPLLLIILPIFFISRFSVATEEVNESYLLNGYCAVGFVDARQGTDVWFQFYPGIKIEKYEHLTAYEIILIGEVYKWKNNGTVEVVYIQQESGSGSGHIIEEIKEDAIQKGNLLLAIPHFNHEPRVSNFSFSPKNPKPGTPIQVFSNVEDDEGDPLTYHLSLIHI